MQPTPLTGRLAASEMAVIVDLLAWQFRFQQLLTEIADHLGVRRVP